MTMSLPCLQRLQHGGNVLRLMLAVGVQLHGAVVVVLGRIAQAGLERARQPQVDRQIDEPVAVGAADGGGLVAAAIVDDDIIVLGVVGWSVPPRTGTMLASSLWAGMTMSSFRHLSSFWLLGPRFPSIVAKTACHVKWAAQVGRGRRRPGCGRGVGIRQEGLQGRGAATAGADASARVGCVVVPSGSGSAGARRAGGDADGAAAGGGLQ